LVILYQYYLGGFCTSDLDKLLIIEGKGSENRRFADLGDFLKVEYIMISNTDIEKLAREIDLPIIGVFSKDLLPDRLIEGSYYVNLQNSDDGDGSHWTLAKVVNTGGDIKAVWFDSFGVGAPKEVDAFLKELNPVAYNNRQIQDINGDECGYYCLYCDYYLTYLRKFIDLDEDYNNFLSIWSNNQKENGELLRKFLKPL
jgi:hypothetical protein